MLLLTAAAPLWAQWAERANEPDDRLRSLTAAQEQALRQRLDRTSLEQGMVESASVLEWPSHVRSEVTLVSAAPPRLFGRHIKICQYATAQDSGKWGHDTGAESGMFVCLWVRISPAPTARHSIVEHICRRLA
jgi:hypothetical protein